MSRPRGSTGRRPRAERVAQIMAAATAEFRDAGFEGASMARIARQADIVEGSIYRFFESKRDLLTKVVEAWYEGMLTDYARELAGISGTRDRLRFMIWRHLRTIRDEPEMCRLMFNHIRSAPDYRETAIFRLNRLYTMRTLDIVREGMTSGELRPGLDLALVRDVIYGGVEHRSWAFLRGEAAFDPDAVADAVVDIIVSGLASSAPGEADPSALRLEKITLRLERAAGRAGSTS